MSHKEAQEHKEFALLKIVFVTRLRDTPHTPDIQRLHAQSAGNYSSGAGSIASSHIFKITKGEV